MRERFTYKYNDESVMIQIVDTYKEEPNANSICNVKGIVDLLNKQNNRIETQRSIMRNQDLENERLHKENDQLRFDFKEMKDLLHSFEDEIDGIKETLDVVCKHYCENCHDYDSYMRLMGEIGRPL